MKFFIVLLVVCSFVVSADEINYSVGTIGICDYATPQQALDAINAENASGNKGAGVNNYHLRLVAETFTGGFYVSDKDAFKITGGYENCLAADTITREPGTQSTIDGNGSVAMALLNNNPENIGMHITGLRVINGVNGGFFPSGGLNVAGNIDVIINESTFENNNSLWGGGIYAGESVELRLEKTMVIDNEATLGGGIYCTDCNLTINTESGIADNHATERGGGLFVTNSSALSLYSGSANPLLNDYGIHNNTAGQWGGGIYIEQSSALLYGYAYNGNGDDINPVSITKNTALQGGGIYAVTSIINSALLNLSGNASSQAGAGVSLNTNSSFVLDILDPSDVPFTSCWNSNTSKCNLIEDNIIQNGAATGGHGGAFDVNDSILKVEYAWFEGNDAGGQGDGAAIAFNSINPGSTIDQSVFHNNGYPTGDDNSMIYLSNNSNIAARQNTWTDNNIALALVHIDDAGSGIELRNSVISNINGDTVLDYPAMANVSANCMLTHESASFPAPPASNNVWQGDPMFYNRAGDDFRVLGQSVTTMDRCAPIVGLELVDLAMQNRQFDVENLANDGINFVDTGAYEYQGISPDVIFMDDFE